MSCLILGEVYPYRPHEDEDTLDFAATQERASLITHADNNVQIGLFNPLLHDAKFYLHLNKNDKQINQLSRNSKAKLISTEILAFIPSYWIDQHYGGKATMYYRYLELHCEAKCYSNPADMIEILSHMLQHYQKEGGYDVLTVDSPVYYEGLAQLNLVELTPIQEKAKWKLGQNLPVAKRKFIVKQLLKRGSTGDLKAAELIKATLNDSIA